MATSQTSERQHTPRRRLARVIAAASAGAAVIAAAALTITTASAHAQAAQTWELAWSDEFNGAGGSQPSTSDWIYDIGDTYPGRAREKPGTGEIAAHTNNPANVSMDGNGNLKITALRDGAGAWTSARIESTRTDFKPPSGGSMKVEGRLQLPQVTGEQALGLPAFWALGSPFRANYHNWPGIGELDFMENVNGLDWTFGTLHCGVAPGGPCNEFNGIAGQTYCGGSCHNGFHTYGFEWDESGSAGSCRAGTWTGPCSTPSTRATCPRTRGRR